MHFVGHSAHVTTDRPEVVARQKLKLVAGDQLSIDKLRSGTDLALIEAGVLILGGLNLRQVPLECYETLCSPLRTACDNGAPVRVFLLDKQQS